MKHPNGYGSVVKLSGNRRKPYVVRKTVGWKDNGQPNYDIIGYYRTRQEGLQALAMYNHTPYDVDVARMTLLELFELWERSRSNNLSDTTRRSYKSIFSHFLPLHDVRLVDIKLFHLQHVLLSKTPPIQCHMKSLYSNLEDLALSLDIIFKKNSNLIKITTPQAKPRKPFTHEEIAELWRRRGKGNVVVDVILILLYTGMRINELLDLKLSDYKDNFLTGGSKTAAGKNRIIPVHPKIQPIIQQYIISSKSGYIIEDNGDRLLYGRAQRLIAKLNIKHTFHECRHTLRSELDRQNANRVCIDLILGHASQSVGERVYTHKTPEELMTTILLILY